MKPLQYYFNVEILPAKLICTLFEFQASKPKLTFSDDARVAEVQDIYLNVSKTCQFSKIAKNGF